MIVDGAHYRDGTRQGGDFDLDQAWHAATTDGGFVWVGMRMPTLSDATRLVELFAVDVEPAELVNPHNRPTIALADTCCQLVVRTAAYRNSTERLQFGEMTILADTRFIATLRFGQASPLAQLRSRLEQAPADLASGPGWVLAEIVAQIVEDYGPALDGLEQDVLEVEHEVFSDSSKNPAKRIYHLKRQALDFWLVAEALQEPLARLVRLPLPWVDAQARERLREVLQQVDRVVHRARTLSDLLTSALDANLAQISVRQNDDMRRISAWVAIAAVPTMVAGIYGMNFRHLPELEWRFGYPLVLAVMVLVCSWMYRRFRQARWL